LKALALACLMLAMTGCGGLDSHVEDDNLRPDVIECEAAAAHIQACCSSPHSLPDCHFAEKVDTCGWPIKHAIGATDLDTPISEDESRTIQNTSCQNMGDLCTRDWPTTQPQNDPDLAPFDYQGQGEVHPDGPCGEWGQF
jgi:hypothetical protein